MITKVKKENDGSIIFDNKSKIFKVDINPDYLFNDGGRSHYFKGKTGDCVVRAITISLSYNSLF